jgi:hypothetical protein
MYDIAADDSCDDKDPFEDSLLPEAEEKNLGDKES